MEIALVVVGGITLMTLIAAGFDYLGKRKQRYGAELEARVKALEEKSEAIAADVALRNGKIEQLEYDLALANKQLEDKRAR